MNDESKAIEESAKTIGKGIDLAHKFGEFIAPLINGSLEQGAGIFEDKLKYMRWERQVRLIERARKFMEDSGFNEVKRPLPLKFGIPFFQGASLEDDDYLQDLWAKLLINSISDTHIEPKRIYIDILERLSSFEGEILDKIYSYPFNESFVDNVQYRHILTYKLPMSIKVLDNDVPLNDSPTQINPEVELALINLSRIGCLSPTKTFGGGEVYYSVYQTFLGKYFYEACTLHGL